MTPNEKLFKPINALKMKHYMTNFFLALDGKI